MSKVKSFRKWLVVLALASAVPPYVRAEQTEKTTLVFEKRKIRVASKAVEVEIADSPEKRERGLMFRTSLPENKGMLFIFDGEQPLRFWMKNTLIPLSIGYFDAKRKLINVQEMTPAVMGELTPKTYPSSRAAKYALEMSPGWFAKNQIKPGAVLDLIEAPKK